MVEDVTMELIYEVLKNLQTGVGRLENDMRDLRFRVGQIEQTLSHHTTQFTHLTHQIDDMKDRLLRIETRLDLVEA